MMKSGIYRINCLANGRCYVGSATDIATRWSVHKHKLNRRTHHSAYMQRAWVKYGSDKFEFLVIEHVPVEHLIEREQHYLDLLLPFGSRGFNTAKKAGNTYGVKRTTAQRQKISARITGRRLSPEHVEKLRMARIGYKHTAQTLLKMSVARLANNHQVGRPLTERQKAALWKSGVNHPWNGRAHSEESKRKNALSHSKGPYEQVSDDGAIIAIWPTAEDAALALGLKWSDTITPHIWTAGTSGSLNLLGVWPLGGDQIVALGAHNNFLFIFGKKQILIYSGATTPSTMTLSDSVTNIGCIARDSVQSTGDDIIFLSSTGVRSLMRTVQEKSAPLREISRNVRDELRNIIDGETLSSIKAVYSPIEAFYAVTFPTASKVYCFDTRAPLDDGASRVTTWTGIHPMAFLAASNRKLYFGKAGYVATYSGNLDDTATYRMAYYTTWVDFGNPIQKSILKKIIYTLIGAKNQPVVVKWAFDYIQNYRSQVVSISGGQATAEYGIAEYGIAQYTDGIIVSLVNNNAGGVGRVIQFGLEAEINGNAVSIQKVEAFTKDGKL